jgi:hypothetical protein
MSSAPGARARRPRGGSGCRRQVPLSATRHARNTLAPALHYPALVLAPAISSRFVLNISIAVHTACLRMPPLSRYARVWREFSLNRYHRHAGFSNAPLTWLSELSSDLAKVVALPGLRDAPYFEKLRQNSGVSRPKISNRYQRSGRGFSLDKTSVFRHWQVPDITVRAQT